MKSVNFKDVTTFEIVRIGGSKDVLFTFDLINPETIPTGLYVYDMRCGDDDTRWGYPVTIESTVIVNRYGSVITTKPIQHIEDDPDHNYIDITDLSFEHITDYDATLIDIRELYPFHDLYTAFETDWGFIDKQKLSTNITPDTTDQTKGGQNIMVDRFASNDFDSMAAHKMNIVYMLFIDKLENMFWGRFENPDIDTNEDFEHLLTKANSSIRFGIHDDGVKNRYKCVPAVSYSDTHRVICLSFYECISIPNCVGSVRISIGTDHINIDGSVNQVFGDFVKDLNNFAKDVEFIYNMGARKLWKKSICDICLEYQYHVADRLASEQISLADFLEKVRTSDSFIDELNYSHTIYRICGDSRIPMITVKELLIDCACNHMYEWEEAVEKSRMFYVENCDLQAVDAPSMTDLDDMVEYDGYKIIDIIL